MHRTLGKLPPIHPRANKRIYLADRYAIDGEDATQMIDLGYPMAVYEQFVDSLPDVICYDGKAGLQEAFREWIKQRKLK
ncbi:hypothetical protein DYU11_20250 [Fibrisoma montanum]|uniref:Uncharacterized protein n=1 Tax=Fibrisoma montanum TaxID=2305895 RepID=A0A418M3J0_9BACT|nr:hypothetical protein [Fibrisoma montanum]RIV20385.1 hypothetical protein DYU11_20250 [Fibrisoma montanum]